MPGGPRYAVEAVIFSWGALVDARRTSFAAIREVTLRVLGHPFPRTADEAALAAGMPAMELFALLSADATMVREQLADEYAGAYLRRIEAGDHLRAGAPEVLQSLQPEVAVAVIASDARHVAERAVAASGLGHLIGVLVCEDGPSGRAPDPAALIEAVDRCASRRADMLYVASRPAERIAGRSAGIRTVTMGGADVVAGGSFEWPDAVIEDLRELLPLVSRRAPNRAERLHVHEVLRRVGWSFL